MVYYTQRRMQLTRRLGLPICKEKKNTVAHSNPERSLSQPPPVGGLRLSSSLLLQAKSKLIMAAVTHRRHSICCGERRDTVWGEGRGGGRAMCEWKTVVGDREPFIEECGRQRSLVTHNLFMHTSDKMLIMFKTLALNLTFNMIE